MFDTPITIVGNVLTVPESRRTTVTGTYVVTFRIASTSRRFDKERNEWVDGDTLRVRVSCWRRLGENVQHSVKVGDPLVVYGRIFTRDWEDRDGNRRTSYELDAISVGHDLAKGVDRFVRRRPVGRTDMVDDEATEAGVGGELSEVIERPERPDDLPSEAELLGTFDSSLAEVGAFGELDEDQELESVAG